MRAFSKNAGVGSAIEVELLALLEGLKLAKNWVLFNLPVERNSIVVLSWENKERSLWRFDRWLCRVFYIIIELGCSFC